MGFEVGRIGRAHYWGLVVLLLIGRALLSKVLGPVPMCLGGLALMYVLLSARFHDFGAPPWLGGSLMALVYGSGAVVGLHLAATAGPAVAVMTMQELAQHVSPLVLVLLVVPELLMLLLAGTVSGHVGRNAYGPPGQGFFGILPRSSDRPTASEAQPTASRMASVLSGQPTSGADAPRQGGVLAPRVARRGASPSFGRR
jgi:uncharacterized membrane protein YhaH (DUF805 family)